MQMNVRMSNLTSGSLRVIVQDQACCGKGDPLIDFKPHESKNLKVFYRADRNVSGNIVAIPYQIASAHYVARKSFEFKIKP